MSEREPSESKQRDSPQGVSLARAARIAAFLFALLAAAIAVALVMTDGTPHVPFDYGGLE